MAKARVTFRGALDIKKMARSSEVAAALEPIADAVLDAARSDPNPEYVASLRKKTFTTSGRGGRVSWQVGAAPIIGARVEAKRGTLARAMGRAGL
jgi:hypothetical protein